MQKIVILKKNILTLVDLKKKTDFNAKISKIESKIPSTNGIPTNAKLTGVENKTPKIYNSVKKQVMMQIYQKLKRNLLIMIMIHILLLQNLIS